MMTIYFLIQKVMNNKRNVILVDNYTLMVIFVFINNQLVMLFFLGVINN